MISLSDSNGAGKAAIKVRYALKKYYEKVDIWVYEKKTQLPFIYNKNSLRGYLVIKVNRIISKTIKFFFPNEYKDFISFEILESNLHKSINNSTYDVVQLNWINNFITIGDINQIKKKIIWRFSDMWPFLGLDHFLLDDEKTNLWKEGRKNTKKLINLDYFMWKKKLLLSKNINFEIITPSEKLFRDVKSSYLFKKNKIHLIRTPINQDKYNNKFEYRSFFRKKYNLPVEDFLILFSSIGGTNDLRKGWDFLKKIIQKNSYIFKSVSVIVIGHSKKNIEKIDECKIYYFGKIKDEKEIVEIYNSVNIVAIPSIVDNLPQVGIESQMCGIPVITFNKDGLKEIVDHKKTGYLSEYMNEQSFLDGIKWLKKNINDKESNYKIAQKANEKYSINKISMNYKKLYENLI